MDVVNYALSKKIKRYVDDISSSNQVQSDWNQSDSAQNDYIKNKPFYDNSWVLDTSNVLETNDLDSDTGFVLVSNNPDDFYLLDDDIIYYGKYYYNIEHKLTISIYTTYDCRTVFYKDDDGNETTMCYVVRQENTSIDIYDAGRRYEISNPSIGIWVKHDPQMNTRASIYTKDVHKLDPKFLPEIPQQPSTMIVNITQNDDGTFSADKTFDEMFELHNNGGIVEVLFRGIILPLVLMEPDFAFFSLLILESETYMPGIFVGISSNNEVMVQESGYTTLPPTSDGDENRFLKGDGTWADLPLFFNDAGELEVTLNGVTKTFVAKE